MSSFNVPPRLAVSCLVDADESSVYVIHTESVHGIHACSLKTGSWASTPIHAAIDSGGVTVIVVVGGSRAALIPCDGMAGLIRRERRPSLSGARASLELPGSVHCGWGFR